MPQIVEVDGIGEIEFPDEMSADDIRSALKRKLPTQAPPEPSSRLPWNLEVPEPQPESWRDTLDLPTPGQAATKLASGVALGYGHALSGIANTVRAMAPVAAVVANRLQPLSETRAPLEGVASLAVNKVGAATKEKSDRILERYNPVSEQAGHGGVLDLIGKVGEAAGTMLPAIPIGAMSPMAAIMGYFPVLSFGSTHEAAKAKYMEAGMSEAEADQKALLPAAASAVITATVGKLFGPKGEDLARAVSSSLSAEAMAAIRQAEQTLTKQSTGDPVRGLMAAIVQNAMHSAGVMFKFSASDQIGQEMLAKATYNPNKSFGEIASDVIATALSSPVIGAAMGLPGGVGEVAAKVSEGMARREALEQAQLRRGSPERQQALKQAQLQREMGRDTGAANRQTEDIMRAGRDRLVQVPGAAKPGVVTAPKVEAKVVEAVPPATPTELTPEQKSSPSIQLEGTVHSLWPHAVITKDTSGEGWRLTWFSEFSQTGEITPHGHEVYPTRQKALDAARELNYKEKPPVKKSTELTAEKPADKPVVPPEPVKPVEDPRADPLLNEVRLQLNLSKEEAQSILATRDWNAQSGVIRQSMTRRGTIGADDSAKAALDQAMEWLDKKGLSDSPQRQPKPEVPPAAPAEPVAPESPVKPEQVAPAELEVAKPAEPHEAVPTPTKFEVQTPFKEGKEPVHATGYWTVVEAESIRPSTNVEATQEKNLNSVAAKQQIAEIARRLEPADLADSRLATTGAPIITRVVEGTATTTKILAGNTRTSGIQLAYSSNGPKAQAYRSYVEAEAKRLGIEDRLAGIENPILVRVATHFRNGTHADFARDSNDSVGREFTPTELAMADARAIQDNELLKFLAFSEDGQINRDFLDKLHPLMKSAGQLRTTEGQYMPAMEKRAEVALMTLIMADHPEAEWLIRQIVENSDAHGITRQVKGILANTSGLLRIRDAMPELDLSQDLANAFRDYLRYKDAKAKGTVTGMDEWLNQQDMFQAQRSPGSALLLAWLQRSTTIKAISEGLRKYISAADDEVQHRHQPDIFNPQAKRGRAEILEGALKYEKPAEQVELNVGGGKPGDGKPVEPEKPVAGPEPVPAEAPPGEIPFEQISEGHRRFAAELIKLEKGGALDAERRILLQELFRNADGKFLGTLTMEASGRIRSGGMAHLKKRTLALREGLLKLTESEEAFWQQPAYEPVVVFLHEFGHMAHQFILTNADRKVVAEAFAALTREERRDLFKNFTSDKDAAHYFAKNEQEFLAQSFAEYWISRKVPTPKLKPILKRLYDTFVEAIKRVLGIEGGVRAQMNTLTPIFEKMMTAAESGEEPTHFMEDAGSAPPKGEDVDRFYSRITRTVEQSPQGKATGAQWKATIRNSKLGFPQAEWDYRMLASPEQLEDGKTYTRQEVLDYLKANEVVVKDVTLGQSDLQRRLNQEETDHQGGESMFDVVDSSGRVRYTGGADDSAQYIADDLQAGRIPKPTHFSTYQLPGAVEGSYREVLLTVPERAVPPIRSRRTMGAELQEKYGGRYLEKMDEWTDSERAEYASLKGGMWADEAEKSARSDANWRDGHSQYSEVANPIVRLRFNERQTSDGKRLLFLEEVQAPQKGEFEKMPALFQKNWREIAFKWAMRHAAENDFDSVGWTTGKQQAERYDLSKQVDAINYYKQEDGKVRISAEKNGEVKVDRIVEPGAVESTVGKAIAAKINAGEGQQSEPGWKTITGADLKIGGEGITKLYDQDFRNVVNGLPVVRKAGQKVGTAKVNTGATHYYVKNTLVDNGTRFVFEVKEPGSAESLGKYETEELAKKRVEELYTEDAPTIHSISITPEMYEDVMAGQARFSMAPTKAEAVKIIETAEQRRARGASRAVEEEARLIGGQVGWLSAKLESLIPRDVRDEDASGRELSDMVRIRQAALEKVGHGEVARTREFIEGFIEPTDFYREMERLATSPIRETFRKEAGMRFRLVRSQMEDVIAEHAKLDAMIQGEWFQEKLDRADIKMQRAHLLEYFQKIFNANVADALAGFAKMLGKEANTEGRAELILGQIASTKKKAEYSEAVRSAVAGMVNKMAQYPEAADLLYKISPAEGDIRAVIDMYRRLQPEGRPEDIIVQWAVETLAHANEATRAIVAVLGAERVESVRKEYTALEQKLADELRANPRQAARAVVRGVRKYATAAERAMVAWRAIHDDIVNTSREYETLSIAADIAKRFMADPTVKQYERDVYGLDRPEGPVIQPRPAKADKYDSPDYATMLPDGTLSKEIKLFGDTDKFEASFAEMNRVMEVISDFLTDNPQDPTVDYWARKLSYFQDVLATSRTMAPSKFVAPWGLGVVNRPLGMLQFFADGLGTREGGRFKVSLTNHNRATELAKKLLHDNVYELTNIHLDAAESHGFTGARSPVTWYEEIGNALYSSWRNPEGGLRAGDRINGYVITDADMKALAFDADVTRQGFKIVQGGATRGREGVMQPVYFETEIGDTGEKVAVQSTDITSHTTTRHYSRRALGIIDSFMEANDGGKLRIINQNFWPLVVAHMRDRSNVFFDGASRFENVYRLLSEEIDQRGLPSADRNLQWLVDKIIEIDGEHLEPPEGTDIKSYVLGELLNEFNQMMTRLKNLGGEDTPNKVETLEQRSSFTKSARRPQAGYWLYDHGFKEMSSLANFTFAIHGYYFERAATDMDRVITDLKASRENLNNRLAFRASQEGTDVVKVRRGVIKEQSARVKSGQTFEDWENIDRQIEVAQRLRDLYKQVYSAGGNAADFDLTKVSRTIGAAVGSTLLSELNTIRNLFTGVLYLGQKINSVDGTIWRAYPEAFWKTQTVGAFKYGASALLGLVKAGTAGPVKGVAAAYRPLLQGKFRVAFARFLEPMLVELSQNMASRIEMQRFLEERGYSEKFNTADDVLAKMRIPTEGGTVRSTPSFDSVLGRGAYGLLTMLEAPIVTGVGKALTPRGLGDLPLNHATITATFDIANRLETRLRWLHAKYKDAGVKRWDFAQLNSPGNHLSAAEVYGKWFGLPRTNQNLNHLVNWFEYGPEGFQDAAIRFLAKLEAGVKDAQFLTDDQKWNLADAAVHDVNKGGVMNRPLQFRRQEVMAQLVAPFLGWPTHRFRTWVKYANRAAVDPQTAKAVMWASVMMTTILPALAVGAIVDPYTELVARWFYRLLRTEERATRLPWERVGAKSQAIGIAISAANMIPFVDAIANTMLNDLPSRARSQPTLFAQNKLMDVLKYFGGVMQTGDWTYGLPQLAKGTLPLSAVVINRLPGVEGSIEALNARRLMTRYGDQDLLRKPAGQTGGQLSELSPYPEKMLNAAMRGDDAGFMAAYQEAVAKATEMGKEDPEKYVAKLFAARNPYDRSFTRKLTAGEQAAFKEKLNPAEAALVNGVEEKFSHAAGLIGASSNFAKQETGGAGGWGGGGSGGIPSIPRPFGLRRGRAGLAGRRVSAGKTRLRLGRGVRLSGPAKMRPAGARLARGRAPKSYQPRLKRFRMRRTA